MLLLRRIAIGFVTGGLLLISGCGGPVQPQDPLIGNPAPDFEVQSLQTVGLPKTLVSCKGKPVILDFWATWCGPCKMLSPSIEKIYEDYKDQGVQAMAISSESREDIRKFENMTPHEIPVYVDQNELATSAYNVVALPTIVVIDRSGKVVYHSIGFPPNMLGQTAEAIRTAVVKALNEPA